MARDKSRDKSWLQRHGSLWRRQIARNPKYWPSLGLAAGILVLDQISKFWILNILRLPERPFGHIDISAIFDLTFVQNRGISFGLFAGGMGARLILSTLSVLVALFLIRWLARQRRVMTAMGVGFIIGGALGNALDRVRFGYVVDFLDFSGAYFPWVFNVADMAINIGVLFLIMDAVRQARSRRPANKST